MNESTRIPGGASIAGLLVGLLSGWQGAAAAAGPVTYSGRATVINATATVVLLQPKVVIGDTGELEPFGTARETAAANVTVPFPIMVQVGTISASTVGSRAVSTSSAAVQTVLVKVFGLSITADAVDANTSAKCHGLLPVSTSGTSDVTNLRINGQLINLAVQPNVTITIPIPLVGSVTLNEVRKVDANTIAVNAIHVVGSALGLAGADIVIGHAESGIKNCT
jgi:hypothetical protein